MRVGVPTEIKKNEHRIGLTPTAVREYVAHGHTVLLETGAGLGAGFTDADYEKAGARIAPDSPEGFATVVEDVIANGRLRKQLATEARSYAREWADTVMAERLAALYRRQLEGRA